MPSNAGCHDLTIVPRVNAEPVLTVVAGQHRVIVPAFGVGTLAGIEKLQHHRQVGGTVQAEMKPLGKFTCVVTPNAQFDGAVIGQADDLNRAGIKAAGNMQCGHWYTVRGSL